MGQADSAAASRLEAFIEEAKASGGSELANYQLFVERLCGHLNLPGPDLAQEANERNDYVFERRVDFKHGDGTTTAGRIDCYKRGCFILEAKQSAKRQAKKPDADQLASLPEDAAQPKLGHAKRGTGGWDRIMRAAKKQAEDYARALPVEHGYPPFLLIVDVGHVIEVFADFSGQGKNYTHFPDRSAYRIGMDDLLGEETQERLRAIWIDPHSLDPAKKSAEVTRDIAERLALIARRLEGKHDPKDVAEFLMRCLFTMFAEDVELIPKNAFVELLAQLKEKPETFVPALEHLWSVMDRGGYEPRMNEVLKRFNGALFKSRRALPLDPEGIHELLVAAKRDWRDVEPAIFGTLLERALDLRERSKLGAHYTPRAYVERLVIPTIIEPLREEWEDVQARIQDLLETGKERDALRAVRRFHRKLSSTRVLDPACGTGNFLYVSLELMKRLEGEVLETIAELGGQPDRYQDYPDEAGRDLVGQKLARTGGRFSVDPHQFYGLEINPRAVPIADLVLWIGYLKWQLRTGGRDAITEPVLDAYGTIREQDAILAYDARELQRDESGKPLSRWDGVTKKLHPVTGEKVPDQEARVPLYTYENPRIAEWPEVEYIVGNPPFIGGKDMRAELGDGYAEACWKARPHVPGGADFVMHFWDEAANRLARKSTKKAPNPLHRFGLITTNSATQTFSRRVIEKALNGKEPVSMIFAVPDHPWLKASDKAAVRIAMTVAERGTSEGILGFSVSEHGLDTDTPNVELETRVGKVSGKLKLGPDTSLLGALLSNEQVGHKGMMPYGTGFWIQKKEAATLRKLYPTIRAHVRPYVNGADLVRKCRNIYAIDFFGTDLDHVRECYPKAYAHLAEKVRPEREANNRPSRREKWWLFAEPAEDMRLAVADIPYFIATTETAKHRVFVRISSRYLADQKVRVIATNSFADLSIVTSRVHVFFSISTGGRQGIGNDPVYQHTLTFAPFPFPTTAERTHLINLGKRLDAFRKERLAEHEFLTMTSMYNVMERSRELENGCDMPPLSDAERDIHDAGLISVLKDLHDEIDGATFAAYGWEDLGQRLVGKPGATMPSPHKSEDQEAAEEELLSRLVTLNLERQAEEKQGLVRWLRPEYQIPKLGHKVSKPAEGEQIEADVSLLPESSRPKWPADGLDQIRVVRDVLARAPAPALPNEIAAGFDGRNTAKRKARIAQVLDTLVATGAARTGQLEGETRYFLPR